MARVRSKDTTPEIFVRRLLHGLGYRFRLHRRDLPGTPDIVLPGAGAVVLVHGCFWHRHPNCRWATSPSTRPDYWEEKFRKTVRRDRANRLSLRRLGWRVVIVWQCETRKPASLSAKLNRLLRPVGE